MTYLIQLLLALACAADGDDAVAGEAELSVDPVAAALLAGPDAAGGPGTTEPALPRAYVDVSLPRVTGRTIRVRAGENLQRAIDQAAPGDAIVLDAGASFNGPITLRRKSGSGWITIRSAGALPAPGTRVTPAHAPQMARLLATATDPVIQTERGASRYRLIGLEVTAPRSVTTSYTMVALGDGGRAQNTVARQPSHLVLDRMYIHGHANLNFQRCVAVNSAWTAIVDSWLSECHGKGFDSQAIAGWNGAGPFKIVNNYLEAAGENVMFGGADPSIPNLTPSDIEIRRNHLFKPLSWKGVWTVKNLFELKHAQRVLVEDNVMENNWVDAQAGFAVLFQALSDDNSAPWTTVRDVTFRYNIVRHSPSGINILSRVAYGPGGVMPREPSQRIHLHDNLLVDIGTNPQLGHSGWLFQLLSDLQDVRIERNTAIGGGGALLFDDKPQQGLVFANNILTGNVHGSGAGEGTAALRTFAPGHVFTGNALIGRDRNLYPAGNLFPRTVGEIGFVNPGAGDYRLRTQSPLRTGTRGNPPGADVDEILRRTADVRGTGG